MAKFRIQEKKIIIIAMNIKKVNIYKINEIDNEIKEKLLKY